ncbi:MAG TPA: Holliday junction resolvase RuvX [Candidatus Cloacimonetes bacterium]|nr:Holliday junction resolvase RuvX [Candidatus Cloacimonadota bacterium]
MSLFRIMGIDYGEVRIGIALSDPLQIISRPYKVLTNSDDSLFVELNEIIKLENVGKIILGLPLNLEGKDSQKTLEVRKFAEELEKKVPVPVEFFDERYTTVEANEALKNMGKDPRESRKVIDKIAASLILRSYLENKK